MNGLRDYHRKAQARAKKAYRNRGSVIWTSCVVSGVQPFMTKRVIQGTMEYEKGRGLRGKAAIKAAKRLTHTKGYYASQRSSVL